MKGRTLAVLGESFGNVLVNNHSLHVNMKRPPNVTSVDRASYRPTMTFIHDHRRSLFSLHGKQLQRGSPSVEVSQSMGLD